MQSSTRPIAPITTRSRATRRRGIRIVLTALLVTLVAVIAVAFVTGPAIPDSTPTVVPGAEPGGDDGALPDGTTLSPFDEQDPAIANLTPELRSAVQDAARAAEADGVVLFVQSGWRSAAYQQRLLDDAVGEYGSLAEAERFVSTPDRSHHVSGDAVDIGPTDAMSWLQQHGSDFDLCQTYANEMWHWELTQTPGTCPDQLSDAGAG